MESNINGSTSAYGLSSWMLKPSEGVAAAYLAAAESWPFLPEEKFNMAFRPSSSYTDPSHSYCILSTLSIAWWTFFGRSYRIGGESMALASCRNVNCQERERAVGLQFFLNEIPPESTHRNLLLFNFGLMKCICWSTCNCIRAVADIFPGTIPIAV
jgi:hypothetical protein